MGGRCVETALLTSTHPHETPCPQHLRKKDFEGAVIGGGVYGLASSAARQNAGISVEVLVVATALGQIMAGIGLGPTTVHSLEVMGLLDAVFQNIAPTDLGFKGFLFYSGLEEA
ncbi:hypothetical protein BD309DRAFT_1014948 [Dichomitus squalens]|nr:hypothetical protein BD309DRAFT_1014948 [Dichomitus squalens]